MNDVFMWIVIAYIATLAFILLLLWMRKSKEVKRHWRERDES